MRTKRSDEVVFVPHGLGIYHGELSGFQKAHRHDEVEIGVIERGSAAFLCGGTSHRILPGWLTLIWGGMPHQVLQAQPGSHVLSLTLPLPWVLSWPLPARFTHRLMSGEVFHSPPPAKGAYADHLLRWKGDLAGLRPEQREIMALEIQAFVRRLAADEAWQGDRSGDVIESQGQVLDKIATMAAYIGGHFAKPIGGADIAAAAGMNAKAAMRAFKATTGMTLRQYLTGHRMVHAQRHLALTDAKMLDVAVGCGFDSTSAFYDAFRRVTGTTPSAYRKRMRGAVQT